MTKIETYATSREGRTEAGMFTKECALKRRKEQKVETFKNLHE